MVANRKPIHAAERARREKQRTQTPPQTTAQTLTALSEDDALMSGQRKPTADELAQAEQFFAPDTAQNLDEVAPDPVSLTVRDYVEREETDADGRIVTRRKLIIRRAEIETHVPMGIFNRVLKTQERAFLRRAQMRREEQAATQDTMPVELDWAQDTEPEGDPILDWMQHCVWWIWRMTEPEMTFERLTISLTPLQVEGLFKRFFGELIRQYGRSRRTAENGTSG